MLFTTVKFTLHGGDENTVADYVDENGKFVNVGARIATALKAEEQIQVKNDGEEAIIPYHAVMSYSIQRSEQAYTKPEDAFCKPLDCLTAPICGGGTTYKTIINETLEFFKGGSFINTVYEGYTKCCNASSIKVTIDGNTFVLPQSQNCPEPCNSCYGEFLNGNPHGNCNVLFFGNEVDIYYTTEGEHSVVIEVPDGSEVECDK